MALPPEHVLIKRKREEEKSPDYLIIQIGEQPYKRLNTSTQCFFKKIPTEPLLNEQYLPGALPSQHDVLKIPAQKAVPNGTEDYHGQNHDGSLPLNKKMAQGGEPSFASNPSERRQRSSPPKKLRAEPRAFYLARNSSSSLPRLSSLYGVHKSMNKKRKDLATFVEARTLKLPSVSFSSTEVSQTQIPEPAVPLPRKRPNRSEPEALWRKTNWNKPASGLTLVQASQHSESDTLRLAQELQQYSIEETRRAINKSQDKNVQVPGVTVASTGTAKGLKFQPKPPPPRIPFMGHDSDRVMTESATKSASQQDLEDDGDDDDYVYDTYVRHIHPIAQSAKNSTIHIDDVMKMQTDSYGLLVITEEDSELWQTYGEDDLSDKDWNSEEEDENAEDFYGNDYPEDEIDSEDEYGRGAYNFRQEDSDDEDYDDGLSTASFEQGNKLSTWKKNMLVVDAGSDNEDDA